MSAPTTQYTIIRADCQTDCVIVDDGSGEQRLVSNKSILCKGVEEAYGDSQIYRTEPAGKIADTMIDNVHELNECTRNIEI